MTARQMSDEAEIRRQIDKLIQAIRAMDVEAMRKVYAPGILSFDVQPPLQAIGAEALLKNWSNAFALFQMPLGYEVRDLAIAVGGDVAFAHFFGRPSGTLKNGSRNDGFWVRISFGLQKIGDNWLVVHEHVSVPFDFISGKALLDLKP